MSNASQVHVSLTDSINAENLLKRQNLQLTLEQLQN